MMLTELPVLVLNPHSRCNCRCAMCDIWKTTGVQEISPADLERQLDSIDRLRVQWVVFSGGEALLHSNLWRLCGMLRERKIRITLLSSGLLLSSRAAPIVLYIDDVIVSLDGPPRIHDAIRGILRAYDLLAAGVAQIRALDPEFGVSARCTVQRSNFRHLAATVETAHALGLNSISFLAADLESTAFLRPAGWPIEKQNEIALSSTEVTLLEAEIEVLIAQGECGGFVRESPAKLRRIARHFRVHLGEAPAVAPECNAPWTSAVVEADGAVRPCFFHRPIGHLASGLSLEQILNGSEAVRFRESLDVATDPICQRCVCSLRWSASSSEPGRKVAVEQTG